MTKLSEQMKDKICKYCGNNQGGCTKDVPYYAVSMECKHFAEIPIEKPKRKISAKRFLKKVLVEIF